MTMRHVKLIQKAIQKHPEQEIRMPASCKTLSACFNEIRPGMMAFWYDRENGSTSVVVEDH